MTTFRSCLQVDLAYLNNKWYYISQCSFMSENNQQWGTSTSWIPISTSKSPIAFKTWHLQQEVQMCHVIMSVYVNLCVALSLGHTHPIYDGGMI